MSSVVLWPFSRLLFRRTNREIANFWWICCDFLSTHVHKIQVEISGDPLPQKENVILVCNHQEMADITVLFRLARCQGRLGDLKWFVKDILKYVPGVGWGLLFLNSVFLKRNWKSDRPAVKRILSKFKKYDIPIWSISFVEGTRVRTHKLLQAQEYAREKGLPILDHVLVPRTKGFVASVAGLRSHLDAVYDATIGYEEGVPTVWQWSKGYVKKVHLHVGRYPIDKVPEDDEALAQWLMERFQEKDARLESFYRDGHF
jgi:1-acyl-sn-glycerol-3-phosphate acyltransferase